MGRTPRVVFLRSTLPHTTAGYYLKAFRRLDVDLVDVPFDPREPQDGLRVPEGDLILLVDCSLPVELPALDACKGPKGYVSIDSCHKLEIHKRYCERYGFDFIWVAQKHVVSELGPRARWLPLAADPEVHVFRPGMPTGDGLWARLTARDHYDIGMCGAPYKHRRRFEKLFKEAGLTTNFHYRKRFAEEATAQTARCTIGFNAGAGFTGAKGMDINMRVFETMAGGRAMLLTNVYPGLGYEELFTDGVHYVTYASEEEAVDKARYYSKHRDRAAAIAREGQRHVLANHTYLHRCEKLLNDFEEG